MSSHRQRALATLMLAGSSLMLATNTSAQIPDEFENLQFFDPAISRDSLVEFMRDFSFALGVRCQYCHVGGDGVSFEGVEFHSDDDPDKRKARFMLHMVDSLNQHVLPALPERDTPNTSLTCKTCHRGVSTPRLLTGELQLALDSAGVDAAVARYRELRTDFSMAGAYDFGEWELIVFAERLEAAGRPRESIALYQLNSEFHPESWSIAFRLGGLYETEGDVPSAIAQFERALELRPGHARTQKRLEQVKGR